jgi:hypothetical protein
MTWAIVSTRLGVAAREVVMASISTSSTIASASTSPKPRGARKPAQICRKLSTAAADTAPSRASRDMASLHMAVIAASSADVEAYCCSHSRSAVASSSRWVPARPAIGGISASVSRSRSLARSARMRNSWVLLSK